MKNIIITSGTLIRLALAPITGHPFDMGLFALFQRVYFQQGTLDLRVFPTLPILYFVQLPFYAVYEIALSFGINDYQLFYHTTFVIESVFLKLPYILADIGVFVIIQQMTGRRLPAALFFLNPLMIFESSVWGIYDSLMILPLIYGLLRLQRAARISSSTLFALSAALKLLGFLPYMFLVLKTAANKNLRTFAVQVSIGAGITGITLITIFVFGGFYEFLSGFLFRFVGLTGVSVGGGNYNLLYLLFPSSSNTIPFPSLLAVGSTSALYIYDARGSYFSAVTVAKWTLVGAIVLNLFSVAEPQWLAWTVPLAIVYGSFTGRSGLQIYAYCFGFISTFLITTIAEPGTGYVTLGLATHFLPIVEGFTNSVYVYGAMVFGLLILMIGYVFLKPTKFRYEIIVLVILVYLQAYFWLSVVNVPRMLGVI